MAAKAGSFTVAQQQRKPSSVSWELAAGHYLYPASLLPKMDFFYGLAPYKILMNLIH
jgi:hypothetical protein